MRGLVGWTVLAIATGCGGSEPAPSRLEARLDRTSVHVHVALRAAMDEDGQEGRAVAGRLAEAGRSPAAAERLAEEMFARRERGAELLGERWRPRSALSSRLEDDVELDPATDQAAFFVALVAQTVSAERRVPKQVLVYEASRLRLGEVDDAVVRRLVAALAQLVYARAGHCDVAPPLPSGQLERGEVRRFLERWLPAASAREEELHADLGRIERVLVGGARACCEIHAGREAPAARAIEGWLDDAVALGVDEGRVALLRGWVGLVDGDLDVAREQLARARQLGRPPEDQPLYSLLRDAVASGDPSSVREAAERQVDRRWLSRLVLVAAQRTITEDGLMSALGAHPGASALVRLAEGEAAVIEAARRRYPLFDQTHQGDRGPLDRLVELFGGSP